MISESEDKGETPTENVPATKEPEQESDSSTPKEETTKEEPAPAPTPTLKEESLVSPRGHATHEVVDEKQKLREVAESKQGGDKESKVQALNEAWKATQTRVCYTISNHHLFC